MNYLMEEAMSNGRTLLNNFAQSNKFFAELETAFGTNYETDKAETLQTMLASGAFLEEIGIEVLPSSAFNGALGAYAAANNTVYLSQAVFDSTKATAVFLEEIGHAVDSFLNVTDSAGDEGAIFSALVRDVSLDALQWQKLREEDDQGAILLDGESITVENANLEWIGGNGDWYDLNNWSTGTVPTASDNVTISSDSVSITITFSQGDPDVNGFSVFASNGGTLTLDGLTSYTGFEGNTIIQATGAGSRLEFPALTTFSGGTGSAHVSVDALEGGVIDMSQLTEITSGATEVFAQGSDSNIDLSNLTSFQDDASDPSFLQVSNGGKIDLDQLTQISGQILPITADGSNSIIDLFRISETDDNIDPTETNDGNIIFLEEATKISIAPLNATQPEGNSGTTPSLLRLPVKHQIFLLPLLLITKSQEAEKTLLMLTTLAALSLVASPLTLQKLAKS